MHHPIYGISSISTSHPGVATTPLGQALDDAINASGRPPDIVFAAHLNNYERFTRLRAGNQIPFVIAGAGGYFNLRRMPHGPDGNPLKTPATTTKPDVTLERYDDTNHGFMRVTVTADALKGEYFAVNTGGRGATDTKAHAVLEDVFMLDFRQHRLVQNGTP
jgi:hypothetical protein